MPDGLPRPEDLVATLRALDVAGGEPDLLDGARGSLESVGWDASDVEVFRLVLEVTLTSYRYMEQHLSFWEHQFEGRAARMARGPAGRISEVSIVPQLLRGEGDPDPPAIPESELDQIWTPGMFRLFLSHVHTHKAEAGQIKRHLAILGVSTFVAHDDIEPTKEWQRVIERALLSAEGMLVLLTYGFHESRWTDQEVGFTMGRGRLVIPVKVDMDPYGFMGKYQAMPSDLATIETLADRVHEILFNHPETREKVIDGLVTGLEQAATYRDAQKVSKLLMKVGRLTGERAQRAKAAAESNSQVTHAYNVPWRIKELTESE